MCSLHYTSVEKVAKVAQAMGRGTLLARLDMQAAYCLILVHPENHLLLGVRWGDSCYIDGMLPFGLKSAPKLWQWQMRWSGVCVKVE